MFISGYIYLVKSRDLNIELLTISTDNIWKLCGLELQDILIQQEFNFIGKDRTIILERKSTFIKRTFNCEQFRPILY
jgi:hypothetical protein